MRMLSGFLISVPLTFLLMLFMSQMVPAQADPPPIIIVTEGHDFKDPKFDDDLNTKDRKPIPPITAVTVPPTAPSPERLPPTEKPVINTVPDLGDFPTDFTGTANTVGGPDTPSTTGSEEAIPMIFKEPSWPVKAEESGYAKFCFTINPDGTVSNIKLKDSAPGKLFVRTTKRALRSWKFRPAYEAGQAVSQHNMCYTMEFNFEG